MKKVCTASVLTSILFITGCALACLENASCRAKDEQAKQVGTTDMKVYCRLLRERNECYESDMSDCHKLGVAEAKAAAERSSNMTSEYYQKCSTTDALLIACQASFTGCITYIPINALDTSYCSNMTTFISCIKEKLDSCNQTVRVIAGARYTALSEKMCGKNGTLGDVGCLQAYYGCSQKATSPPSGSLRDYYCKVGVNLRSCIKTNFTDKGCPDVLENTNITGQLETALKGYESACSGTGGLTLKCTQAYLTCTKPLSQINQNVDTNYFENICKTVRAFAGCIKSKYTDDGCPNNFGSQSMTDLVDKYLKRYGSFCKQDVEITTASSDASGATIFRIMMTTIFMVAFCSILSADITWKRQ